MSAWPTSGNFKRRFPELADGEWLKSQYETHTAHQIARELGCTYWAVCKALRRRRIIKHEGWRRLQPKPLRVSAKNPEILPPYLTKIATRIHQGKQNKMIAYELGRTLEGIKASVATLMIRTRCENRVAIALWVERNPDKLSPCGC